MDPRQIRWRCWTQGNISVRIIHQYPIMGIREKTNAVRILHISNWNECRTTILLWKEYRYVCPSSHGRKEYKTGTSIKNDSRKLSRRSRIRRKYREPTSWIYFSQSYAKWTKETGNASEWWNSIHKAGYDREYP